MPRFTGPIVRRDTSLGVHVRALWVCLFGVLDRLPAGSYKAVMVRTHIAALQRAYPEYLAVNDSELQQWLQELDGIPVSDDP